MSQFFTIYIITLPCLVLAGGLMGSLLWKKNLVLIILALEISYISANVGFILCSLYFDDIFGYIFSLSSLTLAGAEICLGLSLVILVFRKFNNIFSHNLVILKN